jgi:hypothetical protein
MTLVGGRISDRCGIRETHLPVGHSVTRDQILIAAANTPPGSRAAGQRRNDECAGNGNSDIGHRNVGTGENQEDDHHAGQERQQPAADQGLDSCDDDNDPDDPSQPQGGAVHDECGNRQKQYRHRDGGPETQRPPCWA